MDKSIHKYATQGIALSRKILCLLLACTLLIQTGCTTTKVLMALDEKELKTETKTDNQQPLNLKLGHPIRITYMDSLNEKTERQVGRLQSVSSDAIVIVIYHTGYRDKEISIFLKKIKKIEFIEEKMTKTGYVITTVLVLPPLAFIIWVIAYSRAGFD